MGVALLLDGGRRRSGVIVWLFFRRRIAAMALELLENAVKISNEKYQKPNDIADRDYGTSGFRDRASTLQYVMFRVGLVSALRSKSKKATVGVVITASHNAEEDNGVKIIDPMGEMLEPAWEAYATEVVNSSDLKDTLEVVIKSANIDMDEPVHIFLGKDTRPSSDSLAEAVIAAVNAFNGNVTDFGVVTTPQIHYLVRCKNTSGGYGEPSLEGYYKKLGEAFCAIRGSESSNGHYTPKVRLDGSNGVGAIAIKDLRPHLNKLLNIELYNDGAGKLNHLCGADYVKVQQRPSEGIPLDTGVRCVALDGDADRVIYFYICKTGYFRMLDGDKIAALVVGYLKTLSDDIGLKLNLGFVQTAYANGSSTQYVRDVMKVPVVCVPTGVKYLHHKSTQFDVGVYFEANGHGTVTFSDSTKEKIANAAKDDGLTDSQRQAAKCLLNFIDLINETVGDAISDMLVVESILHSRGWSIEDWDNIYQDLPNRQIKVLVEDRKVIKTADAERKCIEPPNLQESIDNLVAQYRNGRAFVRPSGTENVVRVYAEAATQNDADNLAKEVGSKVYLLANGIGEDPANIPLN